MTNAVWQVHRKGSDKGYTESSAVHDQFHSSFQSKKEKSFGF